MKIEWNDYAWHTFLNFIGAFFWIHRFSFFCAFPYLLKQKRRPIDFSAELYKFHRNIPLAQRPPLIDSQS